MRITTQLLTNMGVDTADAQRWVKPLNDVLPEFGINSPLRVAHFLSQVCVESIHMSKTEENLNYSAKRLRQVFPRYFTEAQARECAGNPEKVGNRAYGKLPGQRNRLGNKTFEDGYKYRGRGLIQLTGLANYTAFNKFLHGAGIADDIVANPDLVKTKYAVHSAVWFWDAKKVNALADKDDVVKVTKRVNGGDHGLRERTRLLNIAKKAVEALDTSLPMSNGQATLRRRLSGKPKASLIDLAFDNGWAKGDRKYWHDLPPDSDEWDGFWDAVYAAAREVPQTGAIPEPWLRGAFESGLAKGDVDYWLNLPPDDPEWKSFWAKFNAEISRPAAVHEQTQAIVRTHSTPAATSVMPNLKKGMSGSTVKQWQQFLQNQGIDVKGGADGKFGPGTLAATKAFQKRAGLSADGVVGPRTRAVAVELGFVLVTEDPGQIGHGGSKDYSVKVKVPSGINAGVSSCKQQTMLDIFGRPGKFDPTPCQKVTSARLKKVLVTENVGPFRVTGLKPAVEAVARVFAQVRADHPDLYAQLGTAGMLCCRAVRGSRKNFSNHSWGAAIDMKINGKLDAVKDGMSQVGLTILAPYFNAERFYWGAGFRREDAMHFEASNELVLEWKAQGLI